MNTLHTFLPQDRRRALASGQTLPEKAHGTALFADISGFTPLIASLAEKFGPSRAAEETTHLVNQVYENLIGQVEQYEGSVIDFVGDAITCWFEGDKKGLRGATCALAIQQQMVAFEQVEVVAGVSASLIVKIGLATGPARRFIVGDPALHQIDTLAGETIRQMAFAENLAQKGEIILAPSAIEALGPLAQITVINPHPELALPFAILHSLVALAAPGRDNYPEPQSLPIEMIRPFILPPLYRRLDTGRGEPLPELRPIVAMFLRFTGLDYDHDPNVGQKLDAFIRWVQQTVASYDGHLLQLTIGDKGSFLYIVFGALNAHDDDAVRAVHNASALLTPPAELSFIIPQIGLASGPARTGTYGSNTRRSYGAIGGDVVLAARLMMIAPAGEMRCSHTIYHQAHAKINFENLPPVRVKGRAGLIRIYRPGIPAPTNANQLVMVGRQAEIAQIKNLLTAIQNGKSHILLIEGEAGIGKSRLVSQLLSQLHEQGLTGLIGVGQSIEQQTPYRAWQELLTTYFRLDEIPDIAERRTRVKTLVAQLIPTHNQRLPILNDMLGLNFPENELTISLDANLRQQNMALLVTDLLQVWANQHPLTVILEDAHWLDTLSWQLTAQVARALSLANAPFLLVIVQRPLEGAMAAPNNSLAQLRTLAGFQTLTLSALSPNEITALVSGRVHLPPSALPNPLIKLVQSRANGNPFFAEELLLNLIDTGIIKITANACQITGNLTTAIHTLPDTLHGLILARIDRLPPQAQFVLKLAAVIGRAFAFTPLHAIVNRYEAMVAPILRTHLAMLTQTNFTLLETIEPDLTYLFKHIITQEAAYQTLLFAQRRDLHRLVGEWYESQLGNQNTPATMATTILPLLAYHYHYAENINKEMYYLRAAGTSATKIYANDAAIGFYTRLLALAAAFPLPIEEKFELHLQRGALYEHIGRWAEAEADYQAALTLVEQSNNFITQGKAQLALGNLFQRRGNFEVALSWLTQAKDVCLAQGDKKGLAQALNDSGTTFWRKGEYAQARALYEESLALRRELADKMGIAGSLNNLGNVHYQQSNYPAAQIMYEQSLALWQELNDRVSIIIALNNLGNIHFHQGDYQTAKSYYHQALALAQEIGDGGAIATTFNALAIVAMVENNYPVAQRLYWESLERVRALGDQWAIANRLDNLGRVLIAQGDFGAAGPLLEEALAIGRKIGDKWGITNVLRDLGIVWLGQGNGADAYLLFEEALGLSETMKDRLGISHARRHLGMVHLQQGQLDVAQSHLAESLALRRELGIRWGVASSLCDLGYVALAQREIKKARSLFEEGLVGCQQLGDKSIGSRALLGLALADLGQDGVMDLNKARQFIVESMQVRQQLGQQLALVSNLLAVALLALRLNEVSQAGRLLGAMDGIMKRLGVVVEVDVLPFYGPTLAAGEMALGKLAWGVAWDEGKGLSLAEAVAMGLAVCGVGGGELLEAKHPH